MTTYTKISEDDLPSISIDVSRQISKINPNIYGGFAESAYSVTMPNA